jgi:hypothetical protein
MYSHMAFSHYHLNDYGQYYGYMTIHIILIMTKNNTTQLMYSYWSNIGIWNNVTKFNLVWNGKKNVWVD